MNNPKNPFPSKAIATVYGAMQQPLKTLQTEAIQRAANLAIEYYETESEKYYQNKANNMTRKRLQRRLPKFSAKSGFNLCKIWYCLAILNLIL